MKQDLTCLGDKNSVANFIDCSVAGFHFCAACQRVTTKVQRGVNFVCVRCGSPRVKFYPPLAV